MAVQSSNQSSLSLASQGGDIVLDVKDNSPIHVRITESREITPSVGDALNVYGWVAINANTNGLTLEDDELFGRGVVLDPGTTGTPSTFILYNPIVTQGLTVDQEVFIKSRGYYTFSYAEPRGEVEASTMIWDVLGGGSGSAGVTSVQCTANILVVAY
jgi:hypothetical protein